MPDKEIWEQIDDCTKRIELDPENRNSSHSYSYRGHLYCDLKQYEKAIDDFTKAIELNSDERDFYGVRGSTYLDLKQYEKAIDDFTKAIELDPEESGWYNSRGLAYDELSEGIYGRDALEQYEKAIDDFTKAIELDPENSSVYYYNRGYVNNTYNNRNSYYDMSNRRWEIQGSTQPRIELYEKAIDDFTKAIELKPDYAAAYYRRGCVYDDLEQYEKALKDYDKTMEIDSTYQEAIRSRHICSWCDKEITPDECNKCVGCGNIVCDESWCCDTCGQGCQPICDCEDELYCKGCRYSVMCCDSSVCSTQYYGPCHIDGATVCNCSDCIIWCSTCEEGVCAEDCIIWCSTCEEGVCHDCEAWCTKCEDFFCDTCFNKPSCSKHGVKEGYKHLLKI